MTTTGGSGGELSNSSSTTDCVVVDEGWLWRWWMKDGCGGGMVVGVVNDSKYRGRTFDN